MRGAQRSQVRWGSRSNIRGLASRTVRLTQASGPWQNQAEESGTDPWGRGPESGSECQGPGPGDYSSGLGPFRNTRKQMMSLRVAGNSAQGAFLAGWLCCTAPGRWGGGVSYREQRTVPGVVPHEGTRSRYWGTLAALDPELRAAGRAQAHRLRWLPKVKKLSTGREGCFPPLLVGNWRLSSALDGHNRWGWGGWVSNRLDGNFPQIYTSAPIITGSPTLCLWGRTACCSPVTQEHCQQEEGPEKV